MTQSWSNLFITWQWYCRLKQGKDLMNKIPRFKVNFSFEKKDREHLSFHCILRGLTFYGIILFNTSGLLEFGSLSLNIHSLARLLRQSGIELWCSFMLLMLKRDLIWCDLSMRWTHHQYVHRMFSCLEKRNRLRLASPHNSLVLCGSKADFLEGKMHEVVMTRSPL